MSRESSQPDRTNKKTSREAVDAVFSAITDSLAGEEKVTLAGFGTFQVMERKARKGVNPQTRGTIQIPAKKVPQFKPGKGLMDSSRPRMLIGG